MTALHRAAMRGHTDTVKELLESLAPDERLEYLKAKDKDGMTALHLAAHKVDIIIYVLQSTESGQRSQLLSTSNHGQDPALLLMAEKNNSQDICQILKLLTLTQCFDCMKTLGKNRQTVLHALSANRQKADQSQLSTVVSLTGRFAPELLKIQDTDGNTPADVAETEKIGNLLTRRLETYNLNKPPHVIIFYTTYKRGPTALQEMNTLSDALKSKGLQPDICHNFSKDELLSKIHNACSQSDLSGLMVCIMTHGDASSLRDQHNQPLDIQDIMLELGGGDGIPKVLILQACRDLVAGKRFKTFHVEAGDILVVCATLHRRRAQRNLFIPIFAKHLAQSNLYDDFYRVVTKTSNEMRDMTGQVLVFQSTLHWSLSILEFDPAV